MSKIAEFPTIFNAKTCIRKGLCPVTKIRGQEGAMESHSLYFEQHGTGPDKIVLVMGLNSSSFSWVEQVAHFGKTHSVLVLDNRGVGNSTAPKGPYTTSGMAEDVIVLLDYVGWTKPRDIHIVGVSLGGMVAQELSTRIPERIISLTLAVTTAGGMPWSNLPPWKGLSTLIRLVAVKEVKDKVPMIIEMVYPIPWLNSKDPKDPKGRTIREIQYESYTRRAELTRPQTLVGSVSQMYAGLTHRVSPQRLRQISGSIPKVLIVTGDDDHLVRPSNSVYLKSQMPEAEYVSWSATGHAIHLQFPEKFNALVDRVIKEGNERLSGATAV